MEEVKDTFFLRGAKRAAEDFRKNRYPILAVAIYLRVTYFLFGEVCPMKLLTGFPCPGCGLTRGCVAFLMLRWRESVAFHPTAALWLAAIGFFVVRHYGMNRKMGIAPFVVVSVATLVVYVCRMVTQFPAEGPLAYFEDNLLRYLAKR